MLTVEEKARIHAAMELCAGDTPAAAETLGMTLDKLKDTLRWCPELKERWCEKRTVVPFNTDADTLSPKIIEIPDADKVFTGEERKLVQAVESENAKLQKGIFNLGLTKKEAEMAAEMSQFQRNHFKESVEVVGAGMTRVGIKLQMEVDKVQERLAVVRDALEQYGLVMDESRQGWVDEENKLMTQLYQLSQEIRKVAEVHYKGAYMSAMLRVKAQQQAGDVRSRKPGYQPNKQTVEEV